MNGQDRQSGKDIVSNKEGSRAHRTDAFEVDGT
jgi:hypothetical protein